MRQIPMGDRDRVIAKRSPITTVPVRSLRTTLARVSTLTDILQRREQLDRFAVVLKVRRCRSFRCRAGSKLPTAQLSVDQRDQCAPRREVRVMQ